MTLSRKRYCGARLMHGRIGPGGDGRCRQFPRANGRCWRHGGYAVGGKGPRDMTRANIARARWLELLHALGLKHPGGYYVRKGALGAKKGKDVMAEAILQANIAIEALPATRDVPDAEKLPVELLGEGVRAGLVLTRDTVAMAQMMLDRDGEHADKKFLSMANLTAIALVKLGLKASETGYREDVLGRLLDAIEAEKSQPKESTP
jgi:hypothetical protein